MEKVEIKKLKKKGTLEGLFLPDHITTGITKYVSMSEMEAMLVHRSVVDVVPKPKNLDLLIEIITALAAEGAPATAVAIAKALPCFQGDMYPWARSMLNFYTKGVYSKMLIDLDKSNEEAHNFTYLNKVNQRAQWVLVCEALKDKLVRKLDGKYEMRIESFANCQITEPNKEELIDLLKKKESFTNPEEYKHAAAPDFFMAVSVDYYFFCPALSMADDDEIAMNEDKATASKLYELVSSRHYVLPFWKKVLVNPRSEGAAEL